MRLLKSCDYQTFPLSELGGRLGKNMGNRDRDTLLGQHHGGRGFCRNYLNYSSEGPVPNFWDTWTTHLVLVVSGKSIRLHPA